MANVRECWRTAWEGFSAEPDSWASFEASLGMTRGIGQSHFPDRKTLFDDPLLGGASTSTVSGTPRRWLKTEPTGNLMTALRAGMLTATVTATAANYGVRPRTLGDERPATDGQGERWRTSTNAGELRATGLENLIHDRDADYGGDFDERLANLGITGVRTPPRSPKANAIGENSAASSLASKLLSDLSLGSPWPSTGKTWWLRPPIVRKSSPRHSSHRLAPHRLTAHQ
jgi:hypothetical protein